MDKLIYRAATPETWALIDETLAMDANSKAFEAELRDQIAAALAGMRPAPCVFAYSVTWDSDAGTSTWLFRTEAERDAAILADLRKNYGTKHPKEAASDDWRDLYHVLQEGSADWWLHTEDHSLSL